MNNNGKKVELYSTESCHFCHMAKEFFAANNIPFINYNVGTDLVKRKEMMGKSGQLGVPVLVIDGKDVIVGFDQNKLSHLLGIAV
ncbi:MAG: glutaredoxin domain-containing protein [Patescibacteria group bacterium]